MKTTKTLKSVYAINIIMFLLFFVAVGLTVYTVHEAGGVKAVIIEAGKEVKDIAKEINKD